MKVSSLLLFVKTTVLLMTLLASSAASNSATSFDSKLVYAIVKENPLKNVILSPISIKTSLALAYLGAEGNTAVELQENLQLSGGANKEDVAREFSTIFNKIQSNKDATLKIVNRMYIANKFHITTRFNKLARQYFNANAEQVNFGKNAETANQINEWVEAETNHKIKDIIDAKSLDPLTAAILVNAIYFKATWRNVFAKRKTKIQSFTLSSNRKVKVNMMSQIGRFLYGDLKDLDATAIEMGYNNTDISMLIILPKRVDGLSALEAQLKDVNLVGLTEQLQSIEVEVQLPKFKIEFDISLQPILEQLGMKTMFSHSANFSSLLATKQQISISEVKHKAFIEVNEDGTEAAAATPVKFVLRGVWWGNSFVADHPFYFAIKDKQTVYFAGHVAFPQPF